MLAKEFEKLDWGSKTLEMLKNQDDLTVTTTNEVVSKHNILVLIWEGSGYLQSLLQIDTFPPVLNVRGGILSRDQLSLAVVGLRKMTRYGCEVVKALVSELAAVGFTIFWPRFGCWHRCPPGRSGGREGGFCRSWIDFLPLLGRDGEAY